MYRRMLPPALLALTFLAGCATQQQSPKGKKCSQQSAIGTVQHVRTTAYTHTEPGGSRSASGKRLCGTNSQGKTKSAAADWSRFPLGTQFQILSTGEVYEVCDYGSALVGKNTIDLYKTSRGEMRRWGVRYVDIKILRWGSASRSLEVLGPRAHHSHVRSMVSDLEKS